MTIDKKTMMEGAADFGIGTATTVLSLHAAQRIPNYAGWVLLGAGIIGYMTGNKIIKTASIVAASIGAVKTLNMLGKENGMPVGTGVKGMINKIVPQLNGFDGVPSLGMGNIEQINENLLGAARAEDLLGVNDYETLDELTEGETVSGFGDLM